LLLGGNTKTEELRIRTWISPNKTVTTKIKEDKRTGIKEIELKNSIKEIYNKYIREA